MSQSQKQAGHKYGVTNHCPIEVLQSLIAVESKVVTWNRRAPYYDDNAKVIQLVANSMAFFAVVGACVKSLALEQAGV